MQKEFFIVLRTALLTLVLTGIVYPLTMTGLAQLFFSHQANGSLVKNSDGTIVGSELIAQPFGEPWYFHHRPTTVTFNENITVSGGSNFGPKSEKLKERIDSERKRLYVENREPTEIPIDLLTTSGSGLDPHISPAAARRQIVRIAKNRKIESDLLECLVNDFTESRTFGILGEPRVNVLKLNMALDKRF